MVVGRDYMLKKPTGPSAPKLFLDTKLVPAAVNVLGATEVALNRASARTGLSSGMLLAGVAGVGSLGLYWLLFRSGRGAAQSAGREA
jgi:hypothetical protein